MTWQNFRHNCKSAANQPFTNEKSTFQIAFQIENEETKSERQKTKSKRVSDLDFVYFQIEHPEN